MNLFFFSFQPVRCVSTAHSSCESSLFCIFLPSFAFFSFLEKNVHKIIYFEIPTTQGRRDDRSHDEMFQIGIPCGWDGKYVSYAIRIICNIRET